MQTLLAGRRDGGGGAAEPLTLRGPRPNKAPPGSLVWPGCQPHQRPGAQAHPFRGPQAGGARALALCLLSAREAPVNGLCCLGLSPELCEAPVNGLSLGLSPEL